MLRLESLAGVDQVDDDIGFFERFAGGPVHGALQVVSWFEEPRGIEQHDLGIVVGDDSDHTIPGALWFWARDREMLSDEPVEQGGFTGVWPASDSDEPRTSGHRE